MPKPYSKRALYATAQEDLAKFILGLQLELRFTVAEVVDLLSNQLSRSIHPVRMYEWEEKDD